MLEGCVIDPYIAVLQQIENADAEQAVATSSWCSEVAQGKLVYYDHDEAGEQAWPFFV